MASAMELPVFLVDALARFSAWSTAATASVVKWTNPALRISQRQHNDWPLMRLDHALLAIALYCCLLLLGMALKPARAPRSAASPAAAAVPKPPKEPLTLAALARDPVKIVMIAYNLSQVLFSLSMAVACSYFAYRRGYGFHCNPFDAREKEVALVAYLFYVSKLYDFVDTVFIVARGQWNQFTFLHTYHHVRCVCTRVRARARAHAVTIFPPRPSAAAAPDLPSQPPLSLPLSPALRSIFATWWWVAQTAYTGDAWMPVVANSLVHTVMYYYYFLQTLGISPSWKKQMTQFQLVQFCVMIAQGALNLVYGCAYPTAVSAFYLVYITFMLALFGNFYRLEYHGKKAKAAAAAALKAE